jgi:hypothetical protein
LSTIPMQRGDLGFKLGPNHSKKSGIEWNDLPFPTKPSPKFGTPVPEFALRVARWRWKYRASWARTSFLLRA